jgi:hypothetical protein
VAGIPLARLGGMRLRGLPSPRAFATSLLPIAICTAATMYAGNIAYLHLSVSFIQILKVSLPACARAFAQAESGRDTRSQPPRMRARVSIPSSRLGCSMHTS